ncbi:MAG TPA: hypothetical protein VKE22_18805 [Haliangiales bacterium]|nr:hypothetical protein [Haliangiales bacterium]
MDDRNDRRRDRNLSWREIDQLRDKSRNRDRDPMQKASSPAAVNAQKSYRAALERAFASGTLGELAKTLSRTGGEEAPRPKAPAAEAAPPTAAAPPAPAPTPVEDDADAAAAALPAAPAAPPRDPERLERQKLLARIKEAEGRDACTRAVDAYLGKYDKLPDDYEILTKALAHKGDARVRATLAQLTRMLGTEKPRRARTLAAQLRFLEDTHGDPEIRAAAAEVRGRL